ncbi:MAG: hypothetical protein WCY62_00835 [Clostridia bacterium]|jgi:hypothetical protein
MNGAINKRNVIDWVLIIVYFIASAFINNEIYNNYLLLGLAILGICISAAMLIFKKEMTKSENVREIIAICLLVCLAVYAIIKVTAA